MSLATSLLQLLQNDSDSFGKYKATDHNTKRIIFHSFLNSGNSGLSHNLHQSSTET